MTTAETLAICILTASLLIAVGVFISFCVWWHDHRHTHFNP